MAGLFIGSIGDVNIIPDDFTGNGSAGLCYFAKKSVRGLIRTRSTLLLDNQEAVTMGHATHHYCNVSNGLPNYGTRNNRYCNPQNDQIVSFWVDFRYDKSLSNHTTPQHAFRFRRSANPRPEQVTGTPPASHTTAGKVIDPWPSTRVHFPVNPIPVSSSFTS